MTDAQPRPRDPSIDAFRGLTVLLMILVNLQVPGMGAWPLLVHAPWHGLTFADLVFPWFLLIVGMSLPLALDGRAVGFGAIGRRALLLLAIGLALAWLIRPTLDPAQFRWMGVLQRIAIVYLACALIVRGTAGWLGPAIVAALCLIGHAVLLGLPPPGGAASLARGMGMAGWLDRAVLPGRLYPPGFDPEGVLSTLGAIATGLIGAAVMRGPGLASRKGRAATIGVLMLLAGGAVAWLSGQPVNKPLWTPAFVLVTAGLGLLVWRALRAGWRWIGDTGVGRVLALAGRAALTVYVVHTLLIALLVRRLAGEARLWDLAGDALVGTGLGAANASLVFALAGTILSLAITAALARRGWTLRV